MIKRLILVSMTICVGFSVIVNYIIHNNYNEKIFNNINIVPKRKVAVVLGTSKLYNGLPNLYYNNRINAAYDLYKNGKIKKILVSGDKSSKTYNEPLEMKNDLIKLGVNKEDIYMDNKGFRTYDSIIRAKEVFLLNNFIIVSQKSHCKRALFIAEKKSIKAIAYEALDVQHYGKIRLVLREKLSRVKAGIDIFIK
ncbi:MAG: vancomycin high temperature exclusion protein [Arcobacter sp.]|nr:vancomycin high temperature exclusion protein [Arcobacter sp.]